MRCHLGTVKPVPRPPFIWCFQQPLVTPACVGFTCEDVKWWLSDSHAATLLAGALLQRQVLLTTFFSGLQDLCFSFSVIIFYCLYSLWCTNCPHLGSSPFKLVPLSFWYVPVSLWVRPCFWHKTSQLTLYFLYLRPKISYLSRELWWYKPIFTGKWHMFYFS